jgi:colanic acid biosynthesis glycosyl transferase WcaI
VCPPSTISRTADNGHGRQTRDIQSKFDKPGTVHSKQVFETFTSSKKIFLPSAQHLAGLASSFRRPSQLRSSQKSSGDIAPASRGRPAPRGSHLNIMRYLLLNQFFAPDPAPTGQLLADLASELAAQGYSVTVICSRAAYTAQPPARSLQPCPGLSVVHTPSLPFSRSLPARLLSYLCFYLGALWQGMSLPCPDVVVTLTTPPLLSTIGAILKAVRRSRHYIWEMDVYPDIAVALGALPAGSPLTRAIGWVADCCRRHADGVIVLGPCMRDRLLAHGIRANLHVAENWSDGSRIRPAPPPSSGPLTVLYSGNLGLAHDTATISAAMESLKDDSRFRFVFAGGGRRRPALERFCRSAGIKNTAFTGYAAAAGLSAHLAACHIGLVTQATASLGAVVPSKIYALMAAGRPILYIGPRQSTATGILERFHCGWQADPGDSGSVVQLLDMLVMHPEVVAQAGARARAAFEAYYDRRAALARILNFLPNEPISELQVFEKTDPARPAAVQNEAIFSTVPDRFSLRAGAGPRAAPGRVELVQRPPKVPASRVS